MNSEEVVKALNKLGPLYSAHWGFSNSYDENTKTFIKEIYSDDLNDFIEVSYQYSEIIELSNTDIQYSKIIVKFENPEWKYGKPEKWYNKPIDRSGNDDVLECLNTRSYINVINPFSEIEISSLTKGSAITIDDVLFACRGLCLDGYRCYDSFKILHANQDLLVLEPEIDNFST